MDNNTNNWKEFTLGDVQEEQPRRVAKRSRKPLLVLLIVAVLAVAAVTAAVPRLPRPRLRDSREARNARCIPDTATVWDRPVRWREVVNWSLSPSRFPVTSACIRGATSSGKLRAMPSFSQLASSAGQKNGDGSSGRSASSAP